MKIDFSMIVVNGQPFCSLNLESIYPFANRIIIIEGPVSRYRQMGIGTSNDGTLEAIKNFPDPEHKIILESSLEWEEKDDMVHAQEKWFSPDADWLWAVDADEFYHHDDMCKVINWLESHPNCYSMSFHFCSFYGGLTNLRTVGGFESKVENFRLQRLSPNAKWRTHRPPSMIWAPNGKLCREMGHTDGTKELGVRIFHFAYQPPMRVQYKTQYYQSWSISVMPDYFNKVYVPWMKAKTDEERFIVEKRFNGVQEFHPEVRGSAYTMPFTGKLPDIIERERTKIETQIQEQLKALGIC